MVYRVYVEKKKPFTVEADGLLSEIKSLLQIDSVKELRFLNRYDVEGIDETLFKACIPTVFSEPQIDIVYDTLPTADHVIAVEYLPGQFDQRADSASECIQLISQQERPTVQNARIYLLNGNINKEDLAKIKEYLINPVESREAGIEEKDTLQMVFPTPEAVAILDGFNSYTKAELETFLSDYGLAMDIDDLLFTQAYFQKENRNPTITEIRVLDTYWSDHCRHTTFNTIIDDVQIGDDKVQKAYERYLSIRKELNREKPETLMDIATIAARYLKKQGILQNLDESEEVNACSVKIKADVDGEEQDWLLMFKNETHNHPTEIEPFGGAATCVGGAIRDPLSGRSYVYQAMRVTGAGNPLTPIEDTLKGKLPQRKLITTAASGYASYGNQIGLATGQVEEIYHPGYVAKRMELGAVIGAAPAENVIRETPAPGDLILLLGGRTGRDGIGGATGSSKAHKVESLESCGAEVQKGNAPIERKIQRLFRNKNATTLIKRCNDFGAGGVSVAIGELADGLDINLDAIPKKYNGLDGTELATSESQERMAIVIAPESLEKFMALATAENLEATVVATVTENPRMVMHWQGATIVDLSRAFLDANGTAKHTTVQVAKQATPLENKPSQFIDGMQTLLADLNVCGRKGLVEKFGSTVGASTVLVPLGGQYQLTSPQAMVAKLPITGQETKTCSGMAYGFNPFISEQDQYTGGYLAVVESVSKLLATGIPYNSIYLSFQEFFEKLGNDPTRWGKPFTSLMGALDAQLDLKLGAIGGKDSMSGSFEELDVPPTLVSFAVGSGNIDHIISPEFKKTGSKVVLLAPEYIDGLLPTTESLHAVYETVQELIQNGKVLSAFTPVYGGIAEGVAKMAFGNGIGFAVDDNITLDDFFSYNYGAFILELAEDINVGIPLGKTTAEFALKGFGQTVAFASLQETYEHKLEDVFPYRTNTDNTPLKEFSYTASTRTAPQIKVARPKALITVFPGTNCEYDAARAFEKAGAEPSIFVINNLSPAAVAESVANLAKEIRNSQIVMLPGGFSGGDEPDGSGKLITAIFRNPAVTDAVHELLQQKDGLMLGICNGYQALIKLGLVPYGEIRNDLDSTSPTLTFNAIGRHQSKLVNTRVASNKSPWLQYQAVGDIHTLPVCHGEGRFVATEELIAKLAENGQIASQYVNLAGEPVMNVAYNPNGSMYAIEAITSPDGRVFGKMCHTERVGDGVHKNISGNKYQKLFEGGVDYFK